MSDSVDEFFKRLERKLREMEESIRKDVEKLLSESRSEAGTTRIKTFGEVMEPLYTMRDMGDRLIIYVDLPYASEGTIDVRFEDNKMIISAELKKTLSLNNWSERYKGIEVKQYKTLTAPRLEGRGFCTLWGRASLFRAPHGCCIMLQAPPPAPGRCGLIAN
jgi:HSP20 family molecular chaperone IbpA